MSYTKQNWQSGDTISATKLNHMEDGIATNGNLILIDTITSEGIHTVHTLNVTYDEMIAAIESGKYIAFLQNEDHDGIESIKFVAPQEYPYHVYDEAQADKPVGYYLKYDANIEFYSETSDGTMSCDKSEK